MIGGLNTGRWTGRAEMAEAWVAMSTAIKDLRAIPEEFRELDDGRVLSSSETGDVAGAVDRYRRDNEQVRERLHRRGGRVTSLTLYWDREDAVADLGLTEEGRTGSA